MIPVGYMYKVVSDRPDWLKARIFVIGLIIGSIMAIGSLIHHQLFMK